MMRKRLAGTAFAVLLLTGAGGVTAQDSGAPAAKEAPVGEIEVLGQRRLEREQVVTSLRGFTKRADPEQVVPRFRDAICPRVIGVGPELTTIVEQRISAVAKYVGLPDPEKDCRGNAFVVILDNPPEQFETLIKKRAALIGRHELRDVGVTTLRDELKAGQPVVPWNQLKGFIYGSPAPTAARVLEKDLFFRETPLFSNVRNAIFQIKTVAVVVIDKKQLVDIDVTQVADLASLYLLGSPRRNLDYETLGAPTMLTLFRDGGNNAPRTLTDFDRAYLKGLYSLEPNAEGRLLYNAAIEAYEKQCTEEGVPCPPQALASGK